MTKYEKETIINFNEDSDIATVYSCSPSIWNKLEKLGLEKIDSSENSDGKIISKTYEIDKKLISFRKPRVLSDEQREKLRERVKKMRRESKLSGGMRKNVKDTVEEGKQRNSRIDGENSGIEMEESEKNLVLTS